MLRIANLFVLALLGCMASLAWAADDVQINDKPTIEKDTTVLETAAKTTKDEREAKALSDDKKFGKSDYSASILIELAKAVQERDLARRTRITEDNVDSDDDEKDLSEYRSYGGYPQIIQGYGYYQQPSYYYGGGGYSHKKKKKKPKPNRPVCCCSTPACLETCTPSDFDPETLCVCNPQCCARYPQFNPGCTP